MMRLEKSTPNKGFASLIIIIAVIALLGVGVGGFVFISKKKVGDSLEGGEKSGQGESSLTESKVEEAPASLPRSEKTVQPVLKGLTVKDLQGYWQPRQHFFWDTYAGQLGEIPLMSENAVTYIEFKISEVCVGQFDESGAPKPCNTVFPFTVKGAMIVTDGKGFPPVEAKVKNNGQELVLTNPADRSVMVFRKVTIPFQQGTAASQSQQTGALNALTGIWKIDQAFNREISGYKESKQLAKNIGYQEFKSNGTMCRLWTVDSVCNGYKPYIVIAEHKIKAEVSYGGKYDVFIWKITNGRLELIGDTWKGVYVKINAIEGPIVNNNPLTSPIIETITISAYSVPVGSDITVTCKASDNNEVSWVDFIIVGPKLQAGWRYNPETRFNKTITTSYTYTLPDVGVYEVSCHTFDNEENEALSNAQSVMVF